MQEVFVFPPHPGKFLHSLRISGWESYSLWGGRAWIAPAIAGSWGTRPARLINLFFYYLAPVIDCCGAALKAHFHDSSYLKMRGNFERYSFNLAQITSALYVTTFLHQLRYMHVANLSFKELSKNFLWWSQQMYKELPLSVFRWLSPRSATETKFLKRG